MPPTTPQPPRAHPGPRAVLVGPPGSGKSTVARLLAHELKVASRDTDVDIERTAGKPISEIFVDDGEPRFRELERAAVATALAEHTGVLALGGGAVLDGSTQDLLAGYVARGGAVVFLEVSLAHAAPRVGFNQARPLLLGNPRAQWQGLMERRRPIYQQVATLVVPTDARTPAQVAHEIAAALAPEDPAGAGDALDDAVAADGPPRPGPPRRRPAEASTPTPALTPTHTPTTISPTDRTHDE